MKPDISESSYGFGVVRELENKYGLTSAPMFPSLKDEGKKGGGFDVKIEPKNGKPIFIQLKLSDYIKGPRGKCFVELDKPYYKMGLRPLSISIQHDLLLDLENSGEKNVFYIAPVFHLSDDFNKYFLNRTVLKNSICIRPSSIGPLPDKKNHSVCFSNQSIPFGYFSSEPQLIHLTNQNLGRDLRESYESSSNRGREFMGVERNKFNKQVEDRGDYFLEELKRQESQLLNGIYFDGLRERIRGFLIEREKKFMGEYVYRQIDETNDSYTWLFYFFTTILNAQILFLVDEDQ